MAEKIQRKEKITGKFKKVIAGKIQKILYE